MHITIAGGTGLIGTHLASDLLSNHHLVTIITRKTQKQQKKYLSVLNWPEDSKARLDFIGWSDPDLTKTLEQSDIIINLCGDGIFKKRWTRGRKTKLEASRIEPSETLIHHIIKSSSPPKKYIQFSATGFYGSYSWKEAQVLQNKPFDENSGMGNDYLAHLSSKWEDTVEALASKHVPFNIVRTGIVLDKKEGAFPRIMNTVRFYIGATFGNGKQAFPWIHINDLLGVISYLISTETSGIYNAVGPETATNKDLVKTISKALGKPALFMIPNTLLTLIFGERAILLTKGQHVSCRKIQREGFIFRFQSLAEAVEDLIRN